MAALRAPVFPLSAKNRRGGHFLPPPPPVRVLSSKVVKLDSHRDGASSGWSRRHKKKVTWTPFVNGTPVVIGATVRPESIVSEVIGAW